MPCITASISVSYTHLDVYKRQEQRWAAWLERGDPFYSPHLRRTVEDAGLELQDPMEPVAWR